MRKIFIIILAFFISNCFSQELEPTSKLALLNVLLVNAEDQPIADAFELTSVKTKKKYIVKSNNQGTSETLLPINDSYIIDLEFEKNYDKIDIPNEEFFTLNYKIFYDKNRGAAAKITLIRIALKNDLGSPLSEEITLVSETQKTEYKTTTNIKGYAEVKVPNNDKYILNFKSAPNYDLISVPNIDNYILDFYVTYNGSHEGAIYPSRNKALFNLNFVDLDSKPVAGEEFILEGQNSKLVYKASTDKNGMAHILVPIGESYNISSTYVKNFATKKIESTPNLYVVGIKLMYISSIEFIKNKEEQERRLKEREKEWEKYKESAGTYSYYSEDTVFTAVINRNKQWKKKLIVIDVTGSMQPYTEQVKTWYQLNFAKEEPIQFTLFNDGNNKPDNAKKIGSTGGLYYCRGCDIKSFSDTLIMARYRGNGGDGPENDLEALIAATEKCKNYKDIILVADNYSPVKDIELLKQLNKPVRIILCGAQSGYVNLDYLEIAYYTKGSIHTIEEDIVNIGETIEGSKIKIGKTSYILTNGKFLKYKDER